MNNFKIVAFYPVSNDNKRLTGVFTFAKLPAKYSFSFEAGLINISENTIYNFNYVLTNEYGQTLLNDNKESSFDFSEIKDNKPAILNASASLQTSEISIPLEPTHYSMTITISDKATNVVLDQSTTYFATAPA